MESFLRSSADLSAQKSKVNSPSNEVLLSNGGGLLHVFRARPEPFASSHSVQFQWPQGELSLHSIDGYLRQMTQTQVIDFPGSLRHRVHIWRFAQKPGKATNVIDLTCLEPRMAV
jgi:hypothetical protein